MFEWIAGNLGFQIKISVLFSLRNKIQMLETMNFSEVVKRQPSSVDQLIDVGLRQRFFEQFYYKNAYQ